MKECETNLISWEASVFVVVCVNPCLWCESLDLHSEKTGDSRSCCSVRIRCPHWRELATSIIFDATNVVSRQASFVATKDVFCRDKTHVVATKLLWRQKLYLWQLLPVMCSPAEHSGVTSCYLQLYSDKIKSILLGERNACVAEFYCHRHLGNHTNSSGDLFPFPEVNMVLYVHRNHKVY